MQDSAAQCCTALTWAWALDCAARSDDAQSNVSQSLKIIKDMHDMVSLVCIYLTYLNDYIYVYIYRERERERGREKYHVHTHYAYSVCVYIYIM